MPDIYISIGSNIDRKKNIQHAVNLLAKKFSNVKCSNVYESEAVGFDGDDFYNLVVLAETDLQLESVFEQLKEIEIKCGRDEKEKTANKLFSSRIIDLDLLLYGNEILHKEHYDIPREDILQYAFVLQPLSELAPNILHPDLKVSYQNLWKNFKGDKEKQKKISFKPVNNF